MRLAERIWIEFKGPNSARLLEHDGREDNECISAFSRISKSEAFSWASSWAFCSKIKSHELNLACTWGYKGSQQMQIFTLKMTDSKGKSVSLVVYETAAISFLKALNDVNNLPCTILGGKHLHRRCQIIHIHAKLPADTSGISRDSMCLDQKYLIGQKKRPYLTSKSEWHIQVWQRPLYN